MSGVGSTPAGPNMRLLACGYLAALGDVATSNVKGALFGYSLGTRALDILKAPTRLQDLVFHFSPVGATPSTGLQPIVNSISTGAIAGGPNDGPIISVVFGFQEVDGTTEWTGAITFSAWEIINDQ